MNRQQAIAEVKSRYAEYLAPAKRSGYICYCGNGTGADGDGITIDPTGDGTQLKCFKCGFRGDIIDYYINKYSVDFNEALNALCREINITIDNDSNTKTKPKERATESRKQADFTDYYLECEKATESIAGKQYLSVRGISEATAEAHNIRYDNKMGFIIIPISKSFYIARNTYQSAKQRYKNPLGAKIEIFNVNPDSDTGLYNGRNKPVFVVEGIFDALSIIEAGGEAVAINSTSNARKLIEIMKEKRPENTIILSLDNDDAGKKTTAEMKSELDRMNISYVVEDICNGAKDPNEALTKDREAFCKAVSDAEKMTTKPDNTTLYINRFMAKEIEELKRSAGIKTGFSSLDEEIESIYPGLYVIGGISSVGKTTFIHQIADQMAMNGHNVLYFSMEQSRLEMVSKSIARATAKADVTKAVTSVSIRNGKGLTDFAIEQSEKYCADVGDRISVIEGNFNCTVSFIRGYAEKYIKQNKTKPVIMVDYLQVLQAETDPETKRKTTDIKQITDQNITELKRISRALDVPVFVVSSLNRSNYLTPIDFESFKESGGIEYTADVVWGLQLAILNDDLFNKANDLKLKREKVAEAKEKIPRQIELVCLKNRYGKSRYKFSFTYYPQFDLFVESEQQAKEKTKRF